MGMEREIPFNHQPPTWESIRQEAIRSGLSLAIRMIDGLPAFPDEIPEVGWKELRISTSAGMITLRQQPDRLAVTVWGNADVALRQDWESLAQACEKAIGRN